MTGNDYGSFPVNSEVTSFSVDDVIRSLRSQFEKGLTEHPVYIGDAQINLAVTSTGQGGYRYWFVCPICRARVAKLYAQEPFIACRHCHGLKYRTSRYKGMVEEQVFKNEK